MNIHPKHEGIMTQVSLNEKERELLRLLKQDARQTVSSLAQHLNLSRPTIQNMIAKLEMVAIDRYTVKLKPEFAAGSIRAFVLMNRDPKKSDVITARLKNMPQITSVYTVTGEYDMIIEIETDNFQGLDKLLTDIVVLDGVARTHTYMVLSEKYTK